MSLTPEQVCVTDDMGFTRDPFDTLICAAARSLELPLITRDADIKAAGVVRVVW